MMKIEGMCKCGLWQYGHWGDAPVGEWYCDWQKRYLIDGYCHVCGYHLAYNGFAYKMVRAERAAKLWASVVKLKEEYLRLWEAVMRERGFSDMGTGVRMFDGVLTPEEVAESYTGDTERSDKVKVIDE